MEGMTLFTEKEMSIEEMSIMPTRVSELPMLDRAWLNVGEPVLKEGEER